jgi:hypothetical protein
MPGMHTRFQEAQAAIREVRTTGNPAAQRRVASAITLSETVDRLTRRRALR